MSLIIMGPYSVVVTIWDKKGKVIARGIIHLDHDPAAEDIDVLRRGMIEVHPKANTMKMELIKI